MSDDRTYYGLATSMSTTETNPSPLNKRDWIAGLQHGLAMMECFDEANPRLTASQAGLRCSLSRTAARRYLLTLQNLGYVASDGKLLWPTPRVLRLGQLYLDSARLPRLVQPFLQRITAGTQENAHVSVMDGHDVIYLARNGPSRIMSTGYVLGARVPAQVTAAGMVMLAMQTSQWQADWLGALKLKAYTSFTIASVDSMKDELTKIRTQGWALSEQRLGAWAMLQAR